MTPKEVEFMEKLAKLTAETGVAIGGCGCCGSPHLYDVEVAPSGYAIDPKGENISWTTEETFSKSIQHRNDKFFKA